MSWAKFCPQTHQSAGKSKSKGRGKGNPWLAGTLGRIAFVNSRADTFLGARYRRLARRRGKQKALVATGNSVLTVVYHLLLDPDARFCDLGPGYYESRINKHRPRPGHPTAGAHRPAHRHPRRQSHHHRHRGLTPNPQQHNITRLRRVPSARPLTIRFSGQKPLTTCFGRRPAASCGGLRQGFRVLSGRGRER